MTEETDTMLEFVRTQRLLVWRALNLRIPLPTDELVSSDRSFGLIVSFCEFHQRTPDLRFLLRSLEVLESSLMGGTVP